MEIFGGSDRENCSMDDQGRVQENNSHDWIFQIKVILQLSKPSARLRRDHSLALRVRVMVRADADVVGGRCVVRASCVLGGVVGHTAAAVSSPDWPLSRRR